MEELLTELDDLWQEIENAFETVSGDSKALLAELQKSPLLVEKQFVKNPEYSEEAGSHVMDIYLEVHEHHRQLGLLLERRKMLLNEYLHLCMFDQDSSQVRKSYICLVSKILVDFNPGTVYSFEGTILRFCLGEIRKNFECLAFRRITSLFIAV